MTSIQLAPSGTVEAAVNYSIPSSDRPFIVNGDFARNEMHVSPVPVNINDARSLGEAPSLAREGFAKVRHDVDTSGVGDSPEAGVRYRAELSALMQRITGADEILMLPQDTIRRQQAGASGSPTADFAHSDYSLAGEAGARALFEQPSKPGTCRTAMYNMWRLLSEGPTTRPLALCDSRTLGNDDIILGDTKFPKMNASFEMAFIQANPDHRWIYFPDLTPADLIVFKQADTDSAEPQLVPHTAFHDDSCPQNAAPRVSVESRCIAVWYA